MEMDIYVTDLVTGELFRFPMLPDKISVQTGALFRSYEVLSFGEVKIPSGEKLTGFSWSGKLPGVNRLVPFKTETDTILQLPSYMREWQKSPNEIQSLWSEWRRDKKKLRLLVTETPIHHDVYLGDYTVDYAGGYGDYDYTINFVQTKNLIVRTERELFGDEFENAAEEARPEPPPSSTYTIKSGDTLWGIAQKHLGNGLRWTEIYNLNKDAIEAAAKAHKRSSSSDGHWIYAGTTLTIPA